MGKEIDTSADVLVYDSVTQVWMSQKALDELNKTREQLKEDTNEQGN